MTLPNAPQRQGTLFDDAPQQTTYPTHKTSAAYVPAVAVWPTGRVQRCNVQAVHVRDVERARAALATGAQCVYVRTQEDAEAVRGEWRNALPTCKPHQANANKGSERGEYMIEASLREVGAWRSVGADRNGTIGVGNKTTQKWQEIADPDDVIIVPTDGTKLVIVQRTDLDFDSNDPAVVERTVKAAYYDNRSAEVH